MSSLTLEENRSLASLNTLSGHKTMLKVLKLDQADALTQLKLAHGQEKIVEAALLFRVWDDVIKKIERMPVDAQEVLKLEGDSIYG